MLGLTVKPSLLAIADRVMASLAALHSSQLAPSGRAVSLVNFADELPYLRAEVLPRLERAGLRVPS